MQKLSLVDDTFDLNYTLSYNLSIQVSLDGFSFSILDTNQNKVIYLYHESTFTNQFEFLLKKIKTIYSQSDLLELPFKKVTILFMVPDQMTLLPEKYFQDSYSLSYFNTLFDPDPNSVLLSDQLPEYSVKILYRIYSGIFKFMKEKHPDARFKNNLSLCSTIIHPASNCELTATIHRKYLSILVQYEKQIIFFNSFYYEGENDMLYYILGSIKTIKQKPDSIRLSGIVNKHATIFHRLRQYFETITIDEKTNKLTYHHSIERIPDARFSNLFNSLICE